ncbi:MAG: hypothetical protein KIT84_23800 [Labilithrix sp.]|nr:hypothetical protein [Labilithrix sp.]MCW5814073.1 hypothetical protein [Labilithrix sp.]
MTWRPVAPPERLAAVRFLVGLFATFYVLGRIRYVADFSRYQTSSFAPAGVVRLLSSPLPPAATWTLALACVALGLAFTLGRRLAIVAPAFFASLLWVLSYANSWGKLLHSENLFLVHVGVLALAGARRDEATAGWVLRTCAVATAVVYFVAGVSKLRSGGGAWLTGEALGAWLAWDALRKIELGSLYSPLAPVVAGSRPLLQILAIYTLLVELGAPVALASPRAGRAWALATWAFHAGILATMAIGFFYPLSGIAFAPLLAVERLPVLRRIVQRVVG